MNVHVKTLIRKLQSLPEIEQEVQAKEFVRQLESLKAENNSFIEALMSLPLQEVDLERVNGTIREIDWHE